MLFAAIIACEVGFWVLLGAGLLARYRWRRRGLSTALLICVPLLDVVLLAVSVIDLRSGAEASLRHGLAAAYIAYSVMFGHQTIRWADRKYAHRFAGGPPPPKPPADGWPRVRVETTFWLRMVAAYGITWVVTGAMVWLVGDWSRTEGLVAFTAGLARVPLIAALWPVSWAVSVLRRRGRRSADEQSSEHDRIPG
ncbi:hypothetical protein FB566_0694 [Stackebrandtia endophytica]|uniref:Membrane protein YmcC n=1 Tax=Stackebrandtia endophytica TaxID=1496996 RepID=A0A543ARJ0_9ACTN|nr:hypothetical protein [Stackebrandtia endophytica]TQL75197.1 hypothetical protein FB566_0694 [Stackebrandtia endophytica]